MFRFNAKYFLLAVILFIVEVLIALYVDDDFVRPYFGDFLVVILIYCSVKTFVRDRVTIVAIAVLIFSYLIEIMQYFKFLQLIGLQKSKVAVIIFGNSFAWSDILAYTLGILFVVIVERFINKEV